ncbi:MAG: hypothetical protein Q4D04_03415 [Clostridia bacterium]|nr:hypothetical protein [Clostridia bacterium]
MANEVLKQIEEAEKKAESIRLSSVREARDMIKGVEEAGAANARQSAKHNGEESQKKLEAARSLIDQEIKNLEARKAEERQAIREKAVENVREAGRMIFERVVGYGDN